ncbi:MAG TPA: TIGR03618 family F420-dependent PPOX class oxidoreductase [Candidatus Limnocylindrales bacterium]|nr:TIGR03618 family F420-dependent PPOX class oxidoreductase [Candidatus Limnocylindrales bacterium]
MTDPVTFSPELRAFLAGRHFATLATVAETGAPNQAVVWYRLDADGTIVVNSAEGRRWPADLRRDPRVSIAITHHSDGYRWVGIRGVVEAVIDDQDVAQADIAGLAHRYHRDDPAKAERLIRDRFQRQHRVSFRIRPLELHDHHD